MGQATEEADVLLAQLRARLGGDPIRLKYTDNTRTMLSVVRRDGQWVVRCHHMFRHASKAVVQAVVEGYIRTRGRPRRKREAAQQEVRRFIEAQQHLIRVRPCRVVHPRGHRGKHWDLLPAARTVIDTWFPRGLNVAVGWSIRATRRSMGRWYPPDTYDLSQAPVARPSRPQAVPAASGQLVLPFMQSDPVDAAPTPPGLVIINLLLDNPAVPAFYLDYLLYHEFLHEHLYRVHGDAGHGHTGEFGRLEQQHPDYARSLAWEREAVGELWRRHRIRQGLARAAKKR